MELSIAKPLHDQDLLTLLKSEFLDPHEHQFIANFHLYLKYGNDNDKFVIDLDDVWEWMGYSRRDNAKRMVVKSCEKDVDYTCTSLHIVKKLGVHNKDNIFMNVNTFKSLCMMANTEKGRSTRKYYMKMESIFFKYIEQHHKNNILQIEETAEHKQALEKQTTLIAAYNKQNCVYLIRISKTNGYCYIVKLGETDDIAQRLTSLKQEYGPNIILLDVFPCHRAHHFEQYLLHRNDITKVKIPGTEMLQITEEYTYTQLLKTIEKNIDNFNGMTIQEKLQLANLKYNKSVVDTIKELAEAMNNALLAYNSSVSAMHDTKTSQNKENNLKRIEEVHKQLQTICDKLQVGELQVASDQSDEEKDVDESVPASNRRVYKYSPDDLKTPISTYFGLREAARSIGNPQIHDYHIRNACLSCTVFENFRWFIADNVEYPPESIPQTEVVEAKPQKKKGLLAQIDKDRKRIINIFPSQLLAAEALKIASSSIGIALNTNKKTAGFYWEMYDECSDELKSTFEGIVPQPLRIATCSKYVQRIDPNTNDILEQYACIQDVCNIYRTCHKSIHKACKSGDVFKNFKWNIVE